MSKKIIQIFKENNQNEAILAKESIFINSAEKKRVLFVVLTNLREEGNAGNIKDLPYGVLSIIKYNENVAFFEVLDLAVDSKKIDDLRQQIVSKISEFSPHVVGISIMFDNAYWAVSVVADAVKVHDSSILVVAGGPAVSPIAGKVVSSQLNIDAVCFSEGDLPMRDLLTASDLWFALESNGSWITKRKANVEPQKSLLSNLNPVIDVDYSYVDVRSYERKVSYNPLDLRYLDDLRSFPLVTSRGCPFKCAFCWHSGEDDTSMRYADLDNIIDHINKIVNEYGANCITIYDDMLLLPRQRAKELFRRLAPFNLRIELPNGLSPTYMDEELVALMHQAGVRSVRLAIESGDEWVIKNLVNKPLRIYQVQPVIDALRKYNFWVVGFFVLGMPGETDEHRETTRKKVLEWGIDSAVMSIASPIKGSLLYEECIREGYISNEEFLVSGYLFGENVINCKEFTAESIARTAYLINLEVNFLNFYRSKVGEHELAEIYFNFIIKTYPNHAFGYYCLARAQKELGDMISHKKNLLKAFTIAQTEPEWNNYFNYFKIDLQSELGNYLQIA